jgi:metaxin
MSFPRQQTHSLTRITAASAPTCQKWGPSSTAAPPSPGPLSIERRNSKSPIVKLLDITNPPNHHGHKLHHPSQTTIQGISNPAAMAAAATTPPESSILAVPHAIRSLFKLFPLHTYDAEPLPARAPSRIWARARLYVFASEHDAQQGNPSFNPTCLKWQVSRPAVDATQRKTKRNEQRLSSLVTNTNRHTCA